MTTPDPAAHEAHSLALPERLISQAVREWLDRHTETALAANGDLPGYEEGVRHGIEQMRNGRLDDYWYTLVPHILGQLRRAGLIT